MSWSSARRRDTTLVFKSTSVFTTKGSETARDVLLDIPSRGSCYARCAAKLDHVPGASGMAASGHGQPKDPVGMNQSSPEAHRIL